MSCKKAQEFLAQARLAAAEEIIANKTRLGHDDALRIAKQAKRVIIAKGKKTLEFDPRRDDADSIAQAMLGPTGNLRAPTVRLGQTVVVGFNEDLYRQVF